MGTFLLALVLVMLVVAGMAIGVIMGGKPISGTCGGLNNMGEKGECEICGGNPTECDETPAPAKTTSASDLGYDAARELIPVRVLTSVFPSDKNVSND